MPEPEKTIISVSSHGKRFSAELAWDADAEEIITAFRDLLLASGYHRDTLSKFIQVDESR